MPKALVIGAGSAGPAVAQLLTRHGWDAPVFEARAALDSAAGLFLNVAVNGRRVLDRLGVTTRLLTDAHPAGLMQMYSSRGRLLATVPNGTAGEPDAGGVVVRRGWLQQVLWDAAADAGVRIHTGRRLAQLDVEAEGVRARFADGHVEHGDIVIGADGVGSAVRRWIAPEAAADFTGLVGAGGFARVPDLAPTPGIQRFVFGRRSFFGYLVREDGTVYWFANATASAPPARSSSSIDILAQLRELHGGDPDPVPAILANTTTDIGAYPIFRLPTVPRWWRGRAVAVGDAVHATSPSAGQGASLALEDAAELAAQLVRADGHEAAFAAFEASRRSRAERVVAYAAALDRQKKVKGGRVGTAFRDAMLPLFLRNATTDTRYDWVFDHRPPEI
ncbi:NAD(P)/FAD-dependent oxidoreductase [Microbacterium sp. CIAB417]|uniref:FAD-dependent oxidoreductase n=1 Tax=Microbacterium sp. CIAB417 TaxID=2860287 RepID=UPI001FAD2804|nr:NAD(P)/FAD-dependent oxidoreductase [Microbacterium sp. CIAB417]